MGAMRAALWVILALSLLGFVATFVAESGYSQRAVLVQPVERDSTSDTGWRLKGPATELIGIPESAFVTKGAPGIPPQVDSGVLAGRSEIIPVESVRTTIHAARLGSMAAAVLMAIGLLTLGQHFRVYKVED